MKHLERLVDPGQLIAYPSAEHRRFNEAYEAAQACISSSGLIQELYIVQYRDGRGHLHFSFIPATLIDANKPAPYGLKDLCAVIRK